MQKPSTESRVFVVYEVNNTRSRLASIDGRLQRHIGVQLRELLTQVAGQPVPDRFEKLLDRLDAVSDPEAACKEADAGFSQKRCEKQENKD